MTPTATAPAVGQQDAERRTLRPLAITGVGVVAPTGLGLASLIASPARATAPGDVSDGSSLPPRELCTVPEFKLADFVGRKGIRHIDRMTAFCLAAGRLALADAAGVPCSPEKPAPSDTGVVLGTSTGSVRTVSELAYDTLTSDLPYLLNPSHFPNSVMNSSAGQLAIWSALHGVNATVAGGQLSGVYAMRFARIVMSQGRARRLVVGGVEELSPQTAWAWHHSGALAPGAALGEGCAVFVIDADVDPAEPSVLGELLASEVRYCGEAVDAGSCGLRDGLASSVSRALGRSGVRPSELVSVSLGATGLRGLEHVEERAVELATGRPIGELAPARIARTVGVTYSAAGALQIADLLARWRAGAIPPGPALVTSVGPDGNVGCAVLRRRRQG